MSAALSRSADNLQSATLAIWRAQPGAFLLLGRASSSIPKAGSARLVASLGGVGVFRAEFWPLADETGCAFLAVIRLPGSSDVPANVEIALRGARNGDCDLRLQLVQASSETEFATILARLGNGHEAKLTHFLLEVMRPADKNEDRRPHALLESFLKSAARVDGCVELVLNVPGKNVILQGWGTRTVAPTEVLLIGGKRIRFQAESCEFRRDDVLSPATGIVIAMPAEAIENLVGAQWVFLLSADQILCREIVEPRVLDAHESTGQIRHLLPRLTCSQALLDRMRELAQPGYEGFDTLSGSPRPVRAALDMAVWRPEAGTYLSGWLFDPASHVAKVDFCSGDEQIRIDLAMVRVPREDVSAAFRADSSFPAFSNDEWGLVVSLHYSPSPEAITYLRLTFSDGETAFLPVCQSVTHEQSPFRGLLDSVDLHKPSGLAIVERHLAPFIARCPAACEISAVIAVTGPIERSRAVIVPLRSQALPRALIANFIAGRTNADEQIVFICGPDWKGRLLEALAALIRFYELPASVIVLGRAVRGLAACRAARMLANAQLLMVVSSAAGDLSAEIRHTLFEAAHDYDVLCPTVLYEDHSIRFAGATRIECHDRMPFMQVNTSFAGFPASLVRHSGVQGMVGGTLSCCVIQRSALSLLSINHQFLTENYEELAVFARAEAHGLKLGWAGSVQVTIPEEPESEASTASTLVDGWILRSMVSEDAICAS